MLVDFCRNFYVALEWTNASVPAWTKFMYNVLLLWWSLFVYFSCTQPPPGAQLFAKTVAPARPPRPSQSFTPTPSPPLPPSRSVSSDNSQFNGRPAAPRYPPPPPLHTPNKEKDPYQMVAIKADNITLGGELGQGEFGSVLRGKYKQPNGKIVCTCKIKHLIMPVHDSLSSWKKLLP